MSRPTLLAVSHGTSDANGAAAIQALVDRVAERLPDVDVRLGFVDVQQPDAATAVAESTGPTVVVPLLLSQGFHVRVDLGQAVAGRADVIATPPLGPDHRLAEILSARIRALAAPPDVPIVLAVAGSRHPSSIPDAVAQTALLAEHTGRRIITAYLAARAPSLREALRQHPDAVVATYLLARGFFFDLARRQARQHLLADPLLDGVVGSTVEPPSGLVDLISSRYDAGAALLAKAPSPSM